MTIPHLRWKRHTGAHFLYWGIHPVGFVVARKPIKTGMGFEVHFILPTARVDDHNPRVAYTGPRMGHSPTLPAAKTRIVTYLESWITGTDA